MRTREGTKVAGAKGRLRGKKPELSPRQESHLVALHQRWRAHQRRARGAVLRRPLHRLPGDRARAHSICIRGPDVLPCTSGQLREFRASTSTPNSPQPAGGDVDRDVDQDRDGDLGVPPGAKANRTRSCLGTLPAGRVLACRSWKMSEASGKWINDQADLPRRPRCRAYPPACPLVHART